MPESTRVFKKQKKKNMGVGGCQKDTESVPNDQSGNPWNNKITVVLNSW